jgi:hypothetical protein
MFIAKNNDLIILAKETRAELEQALKFMVYTDIEETEVKYKLYNGEYFSEEEIAEKEHERIQELSMTRSDFFDGTIKAFGLDSDDLYLIIATVLSNLGISEIEKKVALNNFRNALNFYRKHTLFTMLSGRPIPISSTMTILITKEQWDKFFDETHKRNPEAYKELLPPAPTPVINEEPTEEVGEE